MQQRESDFAGTDNHIISFEMKVGSESYKAVILDNEIRLTVPKGTDLSRENRYRPVPART